MGAGTKTAAMTAVARRPMPGKTVGQFLPKLTKRVFEKYGFATAQVATDWASIVGTKIAEMASPERIIWPRSAAQAAVAAEADLDCGRAAATLVLRVQPAYALEMQYQAEQIAERVNAYFGYRAIARVRIVQGDFYRRPQPKAAQTVPAAAGGQSTVKAGAGGVKNPALQSALDRLAANIDAERRKRALARS